MAAHFETDLIVSLARGAVSNKGGPFFVGDANHLLGNAGTRNGSSEQVSSFVNGVALDSFKDVVVDKVLAFVESADPQKFHHSDPRDEHYDWVAPLSAPSVSVSDSDIDARTGSTTVTITDPNNPDTDMAPKVSP